MINWLIVGIVIALVLMGFFAGIEVAFAGLNRLTVELKKKQGKSSGQIFSGLLDEPSRFIGTILIGYTLSLVVFVLLVGSVWTRITSWAAAEFHVDQSNLLPFRLVMEILLSVFTVVLAGEFIPKAFWRSKTEWLLLSFFSSIINSACRLFYPVAAFFVSIAKWILKYLFNVRVDERKDAFDRADLEYFFRPRDTPNEDNKELNTELFENALSLPNIKIRQCLIPRKEITGIDIRTPVETMRQKFADTKLSKLVVFESNIDHIVGYIHQLDLFKKPASIEAILLPIPAVPESMSATDLIGKFSRERKSIAWVVDEFGGTAGIVTMEDLLEEIFGEIRDEYDTEEFEEKKLSDEEFLFSGRLELDYLNEKYNFELPSKEAETLSGLLISQHEKIPRVKERIIIGNYEFEVMAVSDTRIEIVRMKILK
jgi:CBS domain containing-hemolysin-like protein